MTLEEENRFLTKVLCHLLVGKLEIKNNKIMLGKGHYIEKNKNKEELDNIIQSDETIEYYKNEI